MAEVRIHRLVKTANALLPGLLQCLLQLLGDRTTELREIKCFLARRNQKGALPGAVPRTFKMKTKHRPGVQCRAQVDQLIPISCPHASARALLTQVVSVPIGFSHPIPNQGHVLLRIPFFALSWTEDVLLFMPADDDISMTPDELF